MSSVTVALLAAAAAFAGWIDAVIGGGGLVRYALLGLVVVLSAKLMLDELA